MKPEVMEAICWALATFLIGALVAIICLAYELSKSRNTVPLQAVEEYNFNMQKIYVVTLLTGERLAINGGHGIVLLPTIAPVKVEK